MDKETLYDGKYIRVVKIDNWEFVERVNVGGAAIIIPVAIRDNQKHILLIREYRVPLQAYNISLPAGLIGDVHKEDPMNGAARELIEETGYEAGRLRFLTEGCASSGLSNETLKFYLADRLKKVSDGGGDETEDITTYWVPLYKVEDTLDAWRLTGDYIDPKIYMALYFANKMSIE